MRESNNRTPHSCYNRKTNIHVLYLYLRLDTTLWLVPMATTSPGTPCMLTVPENAMLTLNPRPAPDPISSGRPVPGKNVPLS